MLGIKKSRSNIYKQKIQRRTKQPQQCKFVQQKQHSQQHLFGKQNLVINPSFFSSEEEEAKRQNMRNACASQESFLQELFGQQFQDFPNLQTSIIQEFYFKNRQEIAFKVQNAHLQIQKEQDQEKDQQQLTVQAVKGDPFVYEDLTQFGQVSPLSLQWQNFESRLSRLQLDSETSIQDPLDRQILKDCDDPEAETNKQNALDLNQNDGHGIIDTFFLNAQEREANHFIDFSPQLKRSHDFQHYLDCSHEIQSDEDYLLESLFQ